MIAIERGFFVTDSVGRVLLCRPGSGGGSINQDPPYELTGRHSRSPDAAVARAPRSAVHFGRHRPQERDANRDDERQRDRDNPRISKRKQRAGVVQDVHLNRRREVNQQKRCNSADDHTALRAGRRQPAPEDRQHERREVRARRNCECQSDHVGNVLSLERHSEHDRDDGQQHRGDCGRPRVARADRPSRRARRSPTGRVRVSPLPTA